MATIGQVLTSPETGWRRYDNTDLRIIYEGGWTSNASTSFYNGTYSLANDRYGSITLKFYGTKFRLIGALGSNYSYQGKINIDGVLYSFQQYSGSSGYQILNANIQGLPLMVHTVTITTTNYLILLDAIDIDDTGYLVHPLLNQVSSLENMQIGDCILGKYTATTSGNPGAFSDIGIMDVDSLLPVTGSAIPSGYFYFIKVAKGLLIADRVVQHSISWDSLNSKNMIEGAPISLGDIDNNCIPLMTSRNSPEGLVEVSNEYNTSSLAAFNAFDGNPSTWWHTTYGYLTGWISYTFTTPKTIKSYSLYMEVNVSCSPSDWTFEGSNDGVNWIILDTQTNRVFKEGETKVFSVNNDNPFLKYRLNISKNGGASSYLGLYGFKMSESTYLNNVNPRSLSGGVAYADSSGNKSLTDQSCGAWPTNNEWDKYIVNSDLNGKITKGDDNVWHWKLIGTRCKDTPILEIQYSTNKTIRGYNSSVFVYLKSVRNASNDVNNAFGFRPVLEYLEPNSKATTLYY